ncbi:hypothetical protein J6590_095009 [Homalodisca vitripennis]|nr:hypothetical protein J6590_095395 [Homalodisca vitripennis]KAG8314557.1 hypothetical protein J6590_090512 [Homalodisca vitripennis]KAG8319294.1 hypothetical protein J6590_095009 [Homalodisca vitripennis]
MATPRSEPLTWPKFMSTFGLLTFWLKLTAWLFTFANILIWRVPATGMSGALTTAQITLFAHAVPAYHVVMTGIVLIYLLGERPGTWFHIFFQIPGFVLTFIQGFMGVFVKEEAEDLGEYAVYISVVCFIICGVLLVDFIIVTGLLGCLGFSKDAEPPSPPARRA